METLKDAFTPFYERLRRPFVGAFWLSWLFVNWKLWVGLLFYDEVVYGVDKIVFINSHLTIYSLIVKPLFCALLFLFAMPILDLAAFYWQQLIRRLKIISKFKIDARTPVEPETHIKVVQEKGVLQDTLAKVEERYKYIASEAQRHFEYSLAHKKNLLVTSMGYFQGEWLILSSDIPSLRLSFTEDVVSIVRHNEQSNEISKENIFRIIEMVNKDLRLYLMLELKLDEPFKSFDDVWTYMFGGQKSDLRSVFTKQVVFLQINLDKLFRNDFSFIVNGASAEITLVRVKEFTDRNELFTNDVEGLSPMKDRKRPSKLVNR
jgi:hypothetical protein